MRSSYLDRVIKAWTLYLPILTLLSYYLLLLPFMQEKDWLALASMVPASFVPPFGKNVILPWVFGLIRERHGDLLSLALTMGTSLAIDLSYAFLTSFNFDYLLRIPKLGSMLEAGERRLRGIFLREGMRKLTLSFLAIYAFLPFTGSGPVWSSVLGRILGFRARTTFVAVSAGVLLLNLVLALTLYVGEALELKVVQMALILFLIMMVSLVAGAIVLWKRL